MSAEVETRDVDGNVLSVPSEISDARSSMKLVAWSLMQNGGQTQQEILASVSLSQPTVQKALEDLGEYIESHYSLNDARKKVYYWKGE